AIPGVTAPPEAARPPETERFVGARRDEEYDLAVQLHGGGRYSNPFLNALGARHTIGTRTGDAEPLERSLDYVYYQHEVLRALEVVGLAGAAPVVLEPRVEVERAERDTNVPLVALHPGATDPRRRWPTDRFAELAAGLVGDGARILLVGSAEDASLAARILARLAEIAPAAGRRVDDATGRMSLRGLAAALASADLVVANDSGPRHLAQAVGTPTASVYWFGNVVNAGPLGRASHRVQLAWTTRCPVCGRDCTQVGWTAERCEHDVSFVADVTTDAVLADARQLMATTAPARDR
ncbi:MAG TPA: glycosyltransferase family 9 protein, partial [Microbacterium sp.]|nr:glycosyltransferase family 9 protein [Microbacterium sp.]